MLFLNIFLLFTLLRVFEEFKNRFDSRIGRSLESFCFQFRNYLAQDILNVTSLRAIARVQIHFATEIPVENEFLEKMRESAAVKVDKKGVIVKYTSKNLVLKAAQSDGSCSVKEKRTKKMVQFMEEISRNSTRRITHTALARKFKKSGKKSTVRSIPNLASRFRVLIHQIPKMKNISTETKLRMCFVLKCPLDSNDLKLLRKDAEVNVDSRKHIVSYQEHKGQPKKSAREPRRRANSAEVVEIEQKRRRIDSERVDDAETLVESVEAVVETEEAVVNLENVQAVSSEKEPKMPQPTSSEPSPTNQMLEIMNFMKEVTDSHNSLMKRVVTRNEPSSSLPSTMSTKGYLFLLKSFVLGIDAPELAGILERVKGAIEKLGDSDEFQKIPLDTIQISLKAALDNIFE
ncbi:unnamed protein product [Caenorhabditis sp. 36 PRJEB53466]|nr:unnamed protein product [Caenorhabditis sp. 36 PRJEB53466]